jgi:NADPH:quinone reductase-like Zn-dependent oxidoreductase
VQVGDKVATLFNQAHIAGSLDPNSIRSGLGGYVNGCLRQYGAFDESGLLKIPSNLNTLEAATLPCAALTAWNALYGLESRALKPGDTVLTQGTGGVSIFALQFAKAAGARVVSTTSSKEKGELLKKYGADAVINYKEDPNWGETAKKYTPNGEGFTYIIEVGGPGTMKEVGCPLFGGLLNATNISAVAEGCQDRWNHSHYRFPWRRQGRRPP